MWLKNRRLEGIGLESVDFQSNAFFTELVGVFNELKGVKDDALPDHPAAMQLAGLIAHYTGLKVAIVWGVEGFEVCPPLVSKNHPLLAFWADWFRQSVVTNVDGNRLIAETKTSPVGRVNLKTGQVSGVFSTIACSLGLPNKDLTSGFLSPEEFAATTLHELGHLVVYFELLSRTLTTNQILAGLSKKLDESGSITNREAVLVQIKSVANLKELDAAALAKSNDKKVIELVVVTNIAKQLESELGCNIYDTTSFEALADQYAARLGAGRHLILALDKLKRRDGEIAFRSTPQYFATEAFKLLLIAAGPFSFGLTWLYVLVIAGADSTDTAGVYDKTRTRYLRVREQIIEAMKNQKLSADEQTSYADDLVVIDDLLSYVKDRQQFLGYVLDFLSPFHRRRITQEKLQRELESIANNDLFAKAASIKQLSV